MTSRATGTLAVSLATCLWLAGCSAPDSAGSDTPSLDQIAASARDRGHDWQAEQLGDGDITLAEFDEGHRRNLACLDDAGLSYSEPERNVVNGYSWLYDMFWPGMEDSEGQEISAQCFESNLGELSLAMSAWGDWATEPALMAGVVKCLDDKGISFPSEAKNFRDLQEEGADQGLTMGAISTCVQVEMHRLHPGLSYAL